MNAWTGFFAAVIFWSLPAHAVELPSEETRVKIFDRVVAELERIDGEGLLARKNRPEDWKTTVRKLRAQAKAAATPIDFGQVFRKLDATYPNLHAQVVLDEDFDIAANRIRPQIGVRFAAEVVGPKQKKFQYKIGSIETEMMKSLREVLRPAIGDEVLAINGKPISEWSRENFLYCKFPLREQCEINFFDHFRKGYLAWDWRSPLEYTLRRNGRVWNLVIPVAVPPPGKKEPASNASRAASEPECPVEADRYENFAPVYKGFNICAFESQKFPGVTVLRIESFRYREIPKESKVQSLKGEVDQFYEAYWKAKAPSTKKLIIDLIDNGGGDVPIEWYRIFLNKPFQEQFVEFKKLAELEDDRIRKDLFYEDTGKEIWFSELNKKGAYQKVKQGQFLPRVPQFCVFEDRSCAEGIFESRPHGFKGEVRILVNEWCISTCTGFVWQMKQELRNRVRHIGVPDSGDSAYARLFVDVYLDPKSPDGFRAEVSPRPGGKRQLLPEGAVLRQQVTATRSTDAHGKVISAIPTPVDSWIPYRYRHYDESWEAKVFKTALKE
jgi:hypothetical protein